MLALIYMLKRNPYLQNIRILKKFFKVFLKIKDFSSKIIKILKKKIPQWSVANCKFKKKQKKFFFLFLAF